MKVVVAAKLLTYFPKQDVKVGILPYGFSARSADVKSSLTRETGNIAVSRCSFIRVRNRRKISSVFDPRISVGGSRSAFALGFMDSIKSASIRSKSFSSLMSGVETQTMYVVPSFRTDRFHALRYLP